MPEYRICEICNYHNKVAALVCEQCSADLSFIHPTFVDESSLKVESKNEETRNVQIVKTMVMRDVKLVDAENRI